MNLPVETIQICVNGIDQDVPSGISLDQLLIQLNVVSKAIAVEHNGLIVPHNEFSATTICGNDQLEIVTLVGGG